MGTVAVRFLTEPFADQRRNSSRAIGDLRSELRLPAKSWSIKEGRNCIGCFERLLKNLQIFEAFRDHAAAVRIFHAAVRHERPTTNDQ